MNYRLRGLSGPRVGLEGMRVTLALDPYHRRPTGSLNQSHVPVAGTHGIQPVQPGTAPVGSDDDS